MDDEQLRQFIELAGGPEFIEVDGVRYEVESGRFDGGWLKFGADGQVQEIGEFWQERPDLPIESVTRKPH